VTQIRSVLLSHLPYAQYSHTQLAHAVVLPSKVLLNASLHHRQNNRLAKEASFSSSRQQNQIGTGRVPHVRLSVRGPKKMGAALRSIFASGGRCGQDRESS
jgi:hypothetical protein